MNKKDQRRIIREMSNSLKQYMLANSDRIPENWDGHEIRQWFSELADEQYRYRNLDRARLRAYRNDRAVQNI